MPQVTVYIRDKDLEIWKQIERKSQFLSEALHSIDLSVYNRAAGERNEIRKILTPYLKQAKKSVPQAEEKRKVKPTGKLCKIHKVDPVICELMKH